MSQFDMQVSISIFFIIYIFLISESILESLIQSRHQHLKYFINIKISSTITWTCHQLWSCKLQTVRFIEWIPKIIHENGIEGLHWFHTKVQMHVLKRCKFLWFGIFVPNMLLKWLKYGVYLGRRTLMPEHHFSTLTMNIIFLRWGRYAGNNHGENPAKYCLYTLN